MLTVDQVAQKLNVSRNTVISLVKKGQIKAIKIGDQYRIDPKQFEEFMTASEVVPNHIVAGTKSIDPGSVID